MAAIELRWTVSLCNGRRMVVSIEIGSGRTLAEPEADDIRGATAVEMALAQLPARELP